ncbi:MAG: T9SS type A sorting domain-containing protein [Flavobacteriales bacterium]|nr:T9SS type A sorting domain-containing protein [Flavobacteriales bacterium]
MGCTTDISDSITAPTPLVLTITTQGLSSSDTCDGTATASVSGGEPPYTIDWNIIGVPPGPTLPNLCSGTTYTATVLDGNSCMVTNTFMVGNVVGISHRAGITPVQILPNPNTGQFSLVSNGMSPDAKLRVIVYRSDGRTVFVADKIGDRLPIDLTPMGPGVYYLQIRGPKGLLTKKLIVQ